MALYCSCQPVLRGRRRKLLDGPIRARWMQFGDELHCLAAKRSPSQTEIPFKAMFAPQYGVPSSDARSDCAEESSAFTHCSSTELCTVCSLIYFS